MEHDEPSFSDEIPSSIQSIGGGTIEERLRNTERALLRLHGIVKLIEYRQRRLLECDEGDPQQVIDEKAISRGKLLGRFEKRFARGVNLGKKLWTSIGTVFFVVIGALIPKIIDFFTGTHK